MQAWKITVIACLAVAALLVGTLLALSLAARSVDTIYDGIQVDGIELGGMTKDAAAQALEAAGHQKYDNLSVTVNLPLNNTITVTAQQAGLTVSGAKAAEEAWNYGRDGGLLQNLVRYAGCKFLDNNSFQSATGLEVTLDETALSNLVGEKALEIDKQLLESGAVVGEKDIRITKGAAGMTVNVNEICKMVRDALLAADTSTLTYETTVETDNDIDLQALYDKVFKEPVEAVYDPDTNTVSQSVTGVSFDIAAAQKLWDAAAYGDTVTIPLILKEPETTTKELEGLLFRDVLSMDYTMAYLKGYEVRDEVRTSLSGSSANRISNVKKACEALNGLILQPGEQFSYNDTLGERTAANGYLPAPAYANGEVRQEYGGGICQVSSTLYNAVLYSNLKVLERECHQFQVGYLPWGLDATVSWGWPDFKFENNRQYPIKILAHVDDSTNELVIQILGTDVDGTFVVMRFNNWEFYDEDGKYFDADGNPLAIGMKACTWRLVYAAGSDYTDVNACISKEVEAYSTYNYHTEDIESRNVTPTPEPTAVPEATPVPDTPAPTAAPEG